MPAITGSEARIGIERAPNWGTAALCATGDLLTGFTLAPAEGTEVLSVPPIGSGQVVATTQDRGRVAPSVSIAGPMGYDNPANVAIAALFGGASVINLGGGAFAHSILINANPTNYVTVAAQLHSASNGAVEFPTALPTRAALSFPEPVDYIQATIDMLGSEFKISGTTNTYATLNSATEALATRITWDLNDTLSINAQTGADFVGSDVVPVSNCELVFERPSEFVYEAKGTAGLSAPVSVGDEPFIATMTCTFRTLADFTYFAAHQAGTEYKARLRKVGPTLGSTNYTLEVYFPRLKIVEAPDTGLNEPGNNPLTVVFKALAASTNPTGMINRLPYIRIINNRSTAYLAG